MSATGFNANTFGSFISGPGFLTTGAIGSLVVLGISSGGLTFDPGRETSQPDVDGLSTGFEGGDSIDRYNSTISGTMKQASDADLARYFGGAFDSSTPKVLTPPATNTFLSTGSYIRDLRFWMKRGDGKYLAVHFQSALPELGQVKTSNKQAEFPITFRARLVPGDYSNLDGCPYTVEEYAAAPTIGS